MNIYTKRTCPVFPNKFAYFIPTRLDLLSKDSTPKPLFIPTSGEECQIVRKSRHFALIKSPLGEPTVMTEGVPIVIGIGAEIKQLLTNCNFKKRECSFGTPST